MRNPSRKRNWALVIAGLGVAALLVGFILIRRNGPETQSLIIAVLGLKAAVVGGILATVWHVRVVRRYDRAQRNHGVLVRWRIDEARWRLFREAAAALAQKPQALANEFKLPETIPAEGIELVITRDALCLGPEFEPLEKNAITRLRGPVLEIEQLVSINRYQTRRVAFRLPAPEGAESDVARVADHYRTQATTEKQRVRKVAWIALAVVLGILIWIVTWVMTVAKRG